MTITCIFSHQPLFFRGKSKLSKSQHIQGYKFASSGKLKIVNRQSKTQTQSSNKNCQTTIYVQFLIEILL